MLTTVPKEDVSSIQLLYVAGAIFWLIIIGVLGLWKRDSIIRTIALLPFLFFILAFFNVERVNHSENENIQVADWVSVGLIVIIAILGWARKSRNDSEIYLLLGAAITFIILTLFDYWVPDKYIIHVRHMKSIFETYALTLILAAMYMYFINSAGETGGKVPLFV